MVWVCTTCSEPNDSHAPFCIICFDARETKCVRHRTASIAMDSAPVSLTSKASSHALRRGNAGSPSSPQLQLANSSLGARGSPPMLNESELSAHSSTSSLKKAHQSPRSMRVTFSEQLTEEQMISATPEPKPSAKEAKGAAKKKAAAPKAAAAKPPAAAPKPAAEAPKPAAAKKPAAAAKPKAEPKPAAEEKPKAEPKAEAKPKAEPKAAAKPKAAAAKEAAKAKPKAEPKPAPPDPTLCPGCGKSTQMCHEDEMVRTGTARWHLFCFKCPKCNELVSGDCTFAAGKPYHPDCAPEIPCEGCGQSTKGCDGSELLALGEIRYHKACFKCGICNEVITTGAALLPDGKPCHKACAQKQGGFS